VIGVGSFGRHHARIYEELRPTGVELVGLVDIDAEGPRPLAERLGVPLVRCAEDLPGPVDVVSVATPTSVHERVAAPLLRRGVHCLVEKPAGGSTEAVARLREAAREGQAHLQIGMVERYNPVLEALDALPGEPLYVEVQRLAPPTPRITDVGVVLDLMIHDLDLLARVVGREVIDVRATGVRILGAHEDVASARITFEGGCVAQVTASRVAETRCRTLRVFSRHGYLVLDCDRQEARRVEPIAGPRVGDWALRVEHLARRGLVGDGPDMGGPGGIDGAGLNGAALTGAALYAAEEGFASRSVEIPRREPLKAEIQDWLSCVRTGRRPQVDGAAAWRALSLAERILASLERRGLGPVGAG
jgi:predicted dehydrogenase